ncbi:LysR substrate-binding domain-containing protein [soil metagenome]
MARDATAILRHLPYFLVVAEEGSLLAAAARLNTAQSAISRRIKLLEAEIGGVPLFAREPRGMRLLPAGEALLAEALTIAASAERARARIQEIAGGVTGTVVVGFAEIVGRRTDMLGALHGFASAHPTIEFQLRPLLSEEQRDELANGGIDAGILYHAPEEDIAMALAAGGRRFAAHPLLNDRYLLAVPTAHPLARRAELRLADLDQEQIVWASHKKNPRLYERLLVACERQGYTPRIVMETPTSEITMSVVDRGMGIGFVPESLKGHAPVGVTFVSPVDLDVAMQLSLVWRTAPDSELPARIAAHVIDALSNK